VQLAKKTNIDSVTVTRGSSGSFSYSVETSTDGSNWHVAATAPAASTGTDQFTFQPTQAQFVRLDFPGGTGASTPDIDELSVSAP
jgi:F5/8 type C domain